MNVTAQAVRITCNITDDVGFDIRPSIRRAFRLALRRPDLTAAEVDDEIRFHIQLKKTSTAKIRFRYSIAQGEFYYVWSYPMKQIKSNP